MLPKNKRIGGGELVTILKNGKRINTPFFSFIYLKKPESRFAIVVSKNVYKKAVDRNKIKRLFYNKIRSISTCGGFGVFVLKKDITKTTKEIIFDNIIFALKRSGIM